MYSVSILYIFRLNIVSFIDFSTSNDLVACARSWYILDENAQPRRYFLRHLSSVSNKLFWDVAHPVIVEVLRGVMFELAGVENDSTRLPFVVGQSVTEWEVKSALAGNGGNDLSRIHWMHRIFTTPLTENDVNYWDYDDTINNDHKKVGFVGLLKWMKESGIHRTPYTQSSYHDLINSQSYLDQWQVDMTKLLRDSLDDIIHQKYNWERDGDGFGLPGVVLAEMLHHYKWAELKCSNFFGRLELIDKIMRIIYDSGLQLSGEK